MSKIVFPYAKFNFDKLDIDSCSGNAVSETALVLLPNAITATSAIKLITPTRNDITVNPRYIFVTTDRFLNIIHPFKKGLNIP